VHGDVQFANRKLAFEDRPDSGRQPTRQGRAMGMDANERQLVGFGVVLDDLVRHTRQRPFQRRLVHEYRRAHGTKKTAHPGWANGLIKISVSFIIAPCWPLGPT